MVLHLNLFTLIKQLSRYVKKEAKFIKKAIEDEKQIQLLRKQLKSMEEEPVSTADSIKADGITSLQHMASLPIIIHI